MATSAATAAAAKATNDDYRALRSDLAEALDNHGLILAEVGWKENLKTRGITVTMRALGKLDQQIELPFDGGDFEK